ncbi:MAG: ABC transporter permease, partial [Terriglobia bacterium]
ITGLLFGLAPALHASRADLNESLKEGGRTAQADRRGGTRNILVVAEVALALVLLAGAGLLMKSFLRLEEVNLGFDPANVLTLSIALPDAKYPKPQSQALFFQNLLDRVHAIHGVESAGAVTNLPLVLDWSEDVFVEGRTAQGQAYACNYYGVSPGYFRAMGIRLVKGRFFNERDDQQSAPVAVVNESAARRMFPNQDPIGKRIYITNGPEIFREIVGVVADSKQYGADSPYTRQVFEPYLQAPTPQMALAIRTSVPPLSVASEVRNAVFSVDKDQPVADVQTMQELVSRSVGPRQFSVYLLVIFASLALVLATVGIYGLIAYSVSQRTHEIGLRMALGARQGDVLRLVMRQGMVLAALGIGIGIAGALASARVLSGMLFEVRPTDPMTFVMVSGFLGGVALLACYIPARRAARVDPMVALRYE